MRCHNSYVDSGYSTRLTSWSYGNIMINKYWLQEKEKVVRFQVEYSIDQDIRIQ